MTSSRKIIWPRNTASELGEEAQRVGGTVEPAHDDHAEREERDRDGEAEARAVGGLPPGQPGDDDGDGPDGERRIEGTAQHDREGIGSPRRADCRVIL